MIDQEIKNYVDTRTRQVYDKSQWAMETIKNSIDTYSKNEVDAKLNNVSNKLNSIDTSITSINNELSSMSFYTKSEIDQKVQALEAEIASKHPAPEKPLFSFSTISDIHLRVGDNLNDDRGHDDLVQLMGCLKNRIEDKDLNLKYVCCAGDIGYSSQLEEIQTFKKIIETKCPISFDNVYSCNGNHDQGHTHANWRTNMFSENNQDKVNNQKCVSFVDGNFVFAFLSLNTKQDQHTQDSYTDTRYLTTDRKTWLNDVIASAKDKTLVLFMHFPLINRKCADTQEFTKQVYDWVNDTMVDKTYYQAEYEVPYAGLVDCGSKGENFTNMLQKHGFFLESGIQVELNNGEQTECEELIDILKTHEGGKTIVFSGHTHFVFQCEDFEPLLGKGYPNINVAAIPDTDIVTIHIPSLNFPRRFTFSSTTSGASGYSTISGGNPYRQPCQSWLVDVYNDRLVLNAFESNVCHDKKYGDILDKYIYTIDLTDYKKEEATNG